jgi:hypothetical protein
MAVIHHTTMTPGKLELLAVWLPTVQSHEGLADRGRTHREVALARFFDDRDTSGDVGSVGGCGPVA